MVCFDPAGKIKKYTTPEQILDDFYDIRLEHYHKRKVRYFPCWYTPFSLC